MRFFLLFIIILFCSIFILCILYALLERKIRLKLQSEFDVKNKMLLEKEKIVQQRINEVDTKELFARDCYAKAEKIAQQAHEVRKKMETQVVLLEKQNEKLKLSLKNARQNIKRRKLQIQALKE